MKSTDPPMTMPSSSIRVRSVPRRAGQGEDHDAGDSDEHARQQGHVAWPQTLWGVAEDQSNTLDSPLPRPWTPRDNQAAWALSGRGWVPWQ